MEGLGSRAPRAPSITNAATDELRRDLAAWNLDTRIHSVGEFLKAGGGVKCLSLVLDQDTFARAHPIARSPIRRAEIQLQGHLLDAGLLRRALDIVTQCSGSFQVESLDLAERKDQESRTTLRIAAPAEEQLDEIIRNLEKLGASLIDSN